MKRIILMTLLCLAAYAALGKSYQTVRTYPCPEASQGVATDDIFFYGIGNQTIAKYNKATGQRVAVWKEKNKELIRHFDGGIIVDGLLYCSHSNFPEVPMASSIEIFDPGTLQHVKTISLGIDVGSCTWVVRGEGCWYLGFTHYDKGGGEPGKDNSWTQVVQFSDNWQRQQAWILPKELLQALKPSGISGCLFIDGKFYCTGHDPQKIFILEFPPYGMRLCLTGTIDMPMHGQGISIDSEGFLWGIDRATKSVIKTELK